MATTTRANGGYPRTWTPMQVKAAEQVRAGGLPREIVLEQCALKRARLKAEAVRAGQSLAWAVRDEHKGSGVDELVRRCG